MCTLHQESPVLIFIGQASLEKKNVNKTLSFTKITLLVLSFLWIRWRSPGLRTGTNQMIWDFNENNRQNVKEETHGVIQTLIWTFLSFNRHKNLHPVLCVMDRTGQRTHDISQGKGFFCLHLLLTMMWCQISLDILQLTGCQSHVNVETLRWWSLIVIGGYANI